MTKTETHASGDPLEYLTKGVSEIPSNRKSACDTLRQPIKETYGTTVSTETANVIEQVNSAIDSTKLVNAVKVAGLDEVEELDLGRAMQQMDNKLSNALVERSGINKYTSKNNRDSVYIPDLICDSEGGTVFMAKTLTSITKARIAHDLNDNNIVIVVDEYEKWEKLFGWKKLKSLPHGKNKIREELGHRLSDEVLDIVAAGGVTDTDETDDTASTSRGRRTRTAPTDEVLNVARGSAHRKRQKLKAKNIKESFEDDSKLSSNVQMLVLFPATTDLNMTDHWWVAGKRWAGGGNVAIANCNKGTFEYLNECDEVWHIEDYLEQASSYTFNTSTGEVSLDAVDSPERLVFHVVPEDTYHRFHSGKIIENIPPILPEYCEDNIFRAPDLPHPDEMLYAPVTKESLFWMRPAVREMQPEVTILCADSSPRDVGESTNVSSDYKSDYKLYARARLPDWDFDGTELQTLDGASYRLSLDDGGYEIIETLGKLHDAGEQPYSETPESRWDK